MRHTLGHDNRMKRFDSAFNTKLLLYNSCCISSCCIHCRCIHMKSGAGVLHSLRPETFSRTQLCNEFVTGLRFTMANEHLRNTPEGQKVDQCGGEDHINVHININIYKIY